MAEEQKKSLKSDTARDQHAEIGIKDTDPSDVFRPTTHPYAQWFGDAGLGLFIHWGISSVHGGIDLSWGMIADKPWDKDNKYLITPTEYFGLAEQFQPDRYDPARWMSAAADAGVRYAVLTTRHHDGYALWPSKYGEFGVKTHMGGRDLVAEYVKACRENGLKVGLYYSPPDWYFHRQYRSFHYGSDNQARFPGREHYGLDHQVIESVSKAPEGFEAQYMDYIRGQVEELLTQYGKIDVIWFDGGPNAISMERIRQLQPGILINPRMHGRGDFTTPECKMPSERIDGWWELCDIWPNSGWGYQKPESWKSTGWMLSRLVEVRSKGGNYLFNVGPRPNGEMPDLYYEKLGELKDWMSHSAESVFGVTAGPGPDGANVPVTVKGDVWYLHAFPGHEGPMEVFHSGVPKSVTLLRTREQLSYSITDGGLRVELPSSLRTSEIDVVKIAF